jgi:hypothetical protein
MKHGIPKYRKLKALYELAIGKQVQTPDGEIWTIYACSSMSRQYPQSRKAVKLMQDQGRQIRTVAGSDLYGLRIVA